MPESAHFCPGKLEGFGLVDPIFIIVVVVFPTRAQSISTQRPFYTLFDFVQHGLFQSEATSRFFLEFDFGADDGASVDSIFITADVDVVLPADVEPLDLETFDIVLFEDVLQDLSKIEVLALSPNSNVLALNQVNYSYKSYKTSKV